MELLLLTNDPTPTTVLPAVDVLPVKVRSAAPEPPSLLTAGPYDLLLLDARHHLAAARTLCRRLAADGLAVPILAIVTEGGMAAIGPEWFVSDVVLSSAGPAEVHARLRLLAVRTTNSANSGTISVGDLTIEEDTDIARLRGRPLELAYREFELLKFLALHPGVQHHRGCLWPRGLSSLAMPIPGVPCGGSSASPPRRRSGTPRSDGRAGPCSSGACRQRVWSATS